MGKFIIKDWAGNIKFDGKKFDSFEDAWEYLYIYFNENNMDCDEWAQEYYVDPIEFDGYNPSYK